jgi:hypothetical protein
MAAPLLLGAGSLSAQPAHPATLEIADGGQHDLVVMDAQVVDLADRQLGRGRSKPGIRASGHLEDATTSRRARVSVGDRVASSCRVR